MSAPTLQPLLSTTYADLITLDQIALVADPFIADFGAAHDGRTPFINPAPLARWAYGRALPAGRKDQALANKTAFMDWFADEGVKTDAESCSDSIFLYPQSSGRTNYRNQYIRYACLSRGPGATLTYFPQLAVRPSRLLCWPYRRSWGGARHGRS